MAYLSDYTIKQARPNTREYYLKDGAGLFLRIKHSGTKSWVFRFYWKGRQEKLTFGQYPAVTLKHARTLREQAKITLAQGIDPRKQARQQEAISEQQNQPEPPTGPLFRDFVAEWLPFKLKKLGAVTSKEKKNGGRQSTAIQIERYLRLDMLPLLGKKHLSTITRTDLLAVQRKIEARGSLSIAEKVRTWLNEIFRYAVATGVIDNNPASDMDIAAIPYRKINHNPHLRMQEIPELLAKLHHYNGNLQTILGIKLLLLTGVRTGELRFAEWHQFDLDKAIWNIPPEDVKQLQRIKTHKDHNIPDYLVPLSTQAMDIIRQLQSCKYPVQRNLLCHLSHPKQTISENTLNGALKRMGFKNRLTGHGIRATLSTALNELGYNKDWIEAQLSHSDKDPIRKIYNHAQYVEQRRQMMQDWADRLEQWEKEGLRRLALKA